MELVKLDLDRLREVWSLTEEECTPEWNIAHYEKLLSYTKHTVRRKKLLEKLKWWQEMKDIRDKGNAMREAQEAE